MKYNSTQELKKPEVTKVPETKTQRRKRRKELLRKHLRK